MFMGFGLILTIGAVAAVANALGFRPQGMNGLIVSDGGRKSPLDIAKERYARGEIDKSVYVQLCHDLSNL